MTSALAWFREATQLIAVLVWPSVVVGLVLGFRKQLVELFHQLTELSVAGFRARFKQSGARIKEDLREAYIEDAPSLTDDSVDNAERGTARREALRVRYARSAVENPLNAILEAYLALEAWFDEALSSHGLDNFNGYLKLGVPEMTMAAVDGGLIAPANEKTINGLTIMRDLALQRRDEVTPDQAREFLVLTDGLIYSLTNELEKHDSEDPGKREGRR